MVFVTAEDGDELYLYRQNFYSHLSCSLLLLVVYEIFWERLLHHYQFTSMIGKEEGGEGGGFKTSGHNHTNYFLCTTTISAQKPHQQNLALSSY